MQRSEPGSGETSAVRFWINGKVWNPPEASAPSIDQGKLFGIRGLYRTLEFQLPPGIVNDSSTMLRVTYQVRLHSKLYSFIALVTGIFMLLAIKLATRSGDGAWLRSLSLRSVPLLRFVMQLASRLVVIACALYTATIAYGTAIADALPTATVFRIFSGGDLLTGIAFFAPYGVLMFAALGAAVAWLEFSHPTTQWKPFELSQARLWVVCGLPVLLCLFLFSLSAGGWSGHFNPNDLNYMSIAGLIPHSDAAGYYWDTFHLAYFGHWELMGSRRPMAEALREITVVAAGYSYASTLVIQLTLMVLALYAASAVLARYHGIWAGIAFAGLAFIIAQPFLATTLTEPLGYIWGLIALIFFIQSIRQHLLPHALIGLAALTVALLMRMGALFAVPCMVLWIGFTFAQGIRQRVQVIGLACAVVIAVLAVNFALQHLYNADGVGTGMNFSQTVCGLSIGMDWTGCLKLYQGTLAALPNENAQSIFLFAQAWGNLLAHPTILLREVGDNFVGFSWGLWPFMLAGPASLYDASSGELYLILAIVLAPLFHYLRNSSSAERSFWIAMLGSLPLSAAIVMKADGWRLLTVTHLFVAAFLALAFATPRIAEYDRRVLVTRWQPAAIALGAAMILFVIFPTLAHALALRELRARPPIPAPGPYDEIVTGGRRMSGFLVVPDGEAGSRSVPMMQVSEFARMVRAVPLEGDFDPFLDRVLPRVPFAFVGAGRMYGPNNTNIYIVPPEVLERHDVWGWRFTTRSGAEGKKPWSVLRDVIAAEPLP